MKARVFLAVVKSELQVPFADDEAAMGLEEVKPSVLSRLTGMLRPASPSAPLPRVSDRNVPRSVDYAAEAAKKAEAASTRTGRKRTRREYEEVAIE